VPIKILKYQLVKMPVVVPMIPRLHFEVHKQHAPRIIGARKTQQYQRKNVKVPDRAMEKAFTNPLNNEYAIE